MLAWNRRYAEQGALREETFPRKQTMESSVRTTMNRGPLGCGAFEEGMVVTVRLRVRESGGASPLYEAYEVDPVLLPRCA